LTTVNKRGGHFNRRSALDLWHRVTLNTVRQTGPDLTTRQLAILTTVYLEVGPHTVKSLALKLHVTKAVITRAIDTLGRYRFIERVSDPRDKRSVVIKRTGPGSAYLSGFAEQICRQAQPDVGSDLELTTAA